MKSVEDLTKRLERVEAVLWAIAFHKPIGCDEHGRLVAIPGQISVIFAR